MQAVTTNDVQRFTDAEHAVDAVLERVGRAIVLGLPLGLGKANLFANALFARAVADSTIELQIFSALTLERPHPKSELEARFLGPFVDRVFGDYPELSYTHALRRGTLPKNIRISEFFFQPGAWLSHPGAQQAYSSTNYTHATRDLLAAGCNVIAQLVDKRSGDVGQRLSLSCNPEMTLDLLPMLREREKETGRPVAMVGEVNDTLPFMFNDAEVSADFFDVLLDTGPPYFTLFSLPHQSVDLVDYAAGFHAASLVQDGGTLQIGIGSLSDAIARCLILRHQSPDEYAALLAAVPSQATHLIREQGRFEQGLYGCSEMVVDGFLSLIEAGVVCRPVYPDVHLERALVGLHDRHKASLALVDRLMFEGAIEAKPTASDVELLKSWGVLAPTVELKDERLVVGGVEVPCDFRDETTRQTLSRDGLGDELADAVIMHGGFFVGSRAFYKALKAMPDKERHLINMTRISFVNQLYGDEELKRLQRPRARFINTAMMMTLTGAVISDGIEDGRVVSGVGGQYNFVAMAHELEGARSVLIVRSTRTSDGQVISNLRWSYGHCTIPRHLRDIAVTEYGIADLRGRSDRDCIVAMLHIADSRFQDGLLAQAKKAGKVEQGYTIPDRWRGNTPERLERELGPARKSGVLPPFPFGTDLTDDELALGKALNWLKVQTSTPARRAQTIARAAVGKAKATERQSLLERMSLAHPSNMSERLYRRLVLYALDKTS